METEPPIVFMDSSAIDRLAWAHSKGVWGLGM
jgi:hypothetical protein